MRVATYAYERICFRARGETTRYELDGTIVAYLKEHKVDANKPQPPRRDVRHTECSLAVALATHETQVPAQRVVL